MNTSAKRVQILNHIHVGESKASHDRSSNLALFIAIDLIFVKTSNTSSYTSSVTIFQNY